MIIVLIAKIPGQRIIIAFQELYELAQRKFLRQLAEYADRGGDSHVYPRLIVVDFLSMVRQHEQGRYWSNSMNKVDIGQTA